MITNRRKPAIVTLLFLSGIILTNCTGSITSVTETIGKTATLPSTLVITPTQTKEPTVQTASPTPTVDDSTYAPLVISSQFNIETGEELENRMLFTMQLDGTIDKQLTESDLRYYYPRWSPDCRKITFFVDVGYKENIYDTRIGFIDLDTNTLTEISTPFERNRYPSWSPDSRRIVFEANDGQSWQIYVVDLDTDDISQLTFEGDNQYPDWSPTGDQITFVSSRETVDVWSVWLMNVDGSEQREIFPAIRRSELGDWDNPSLNWALDPTFSPNGKFIVFSVEEAVPVLELNERTVFKLYIVELDGLNSHRLIPGDRRITNRNDPDYYYSSEFDAAWSPDGQQILFTRTRQLSKDDQLCIVNLANGEWSCQAEGSAAGFWGMDWCHNSDQDAIKD